MEFFKRLMTDRWGRRREDFDWRVYQTPRDLESVESVLVLHLNDKLGDALMISLLVDALAKARPGIPIAVGTTAGYVEYWGHHPRVSEVVVLPCSRKLGRRTGRRVREARRAARTLRGRFDVAVSFEPYAKPDHFALLRGLAPQTIVGFNKHPYRLFDYSLEERRHGVIAESVATRTLRVMRVLGRQVALADLAFHVPFSPEDRLAVEAGLPLGAPRLLFNVYGGTPYKSLTPASVAQGVAALRAAGHAGPIILSAPEGASETFLRALRTAGLERDVSAINPMRDHSALFALVASVDAVVSPDTAVGHVAAALDKPQIVLFAEGGTVPIAWRPLSDRCESVVSTTGRDVNDLDWEAFAAAARRLRAMTVAA